MNVPVYVEGRFVRFVSAKQFGAEVAGKVLKAKPGFWRKAVRKHGAWFVSYFEPTKNELEAWAERPIGLSRSVLQNLFVAH